MTRSGPVWARALHALTDMTRSRLPALSRALFSSALLGALVGCQQDGRQAFIQAAEEHAVEEQPNPEEAKVRPNEPAEIYYDLTHHEWYRRGQPLLVDGQPFQPASRPEPTMARTFEPAGRYEGVTYYVIEGATPPYTVVYVPVSRGYWQPFLPTATQPPQTREPV